MYDVETTERNIEQAEAILGRKLRRYTIETCDAMTAALAGVVVDPTAEELTFTRALSEDETEFVENERILCTLDFRYWAPRYCWIVDADGQPKRLNLTIGQRIFLDRIGLRERLFVAIIVLLLKARQGGLSTVCIAIDAFLTMFYTGRRGIISSSTPGKSSKLCAKLKNILDRSPWWLRPQMETWKITEQKIGHFAHMEAMGNDIYICAGNQKSGMGRGDTLQWGHISEPDEYLNPREDIQASFLEAVHHYPLTFVVVEGTGGQPNTWWHQTYTSEKRAAKTGRAKFMTMFLPWYLFTDIHPTATWLRAHPAPADWEPMTVTLNQARNAADHVACNPEIEQYLGVGWQMPREQMWEYECEYLFARENKTLFAFMREWAADDISAFSSQVESAFSEELIMRLENSCREPRAVYAVQDSRASVGHISPVFRPDANDLYRPRPNDQTLKDFPLTIPITCQWSRGLKPYDFCLRRLEWTGYSNEDPLGNKLLIWNLPQPGEEYVLGVDLSNGVGQDRTAVEVLQRANGLHEDRQVAELANPYIAAHDLWPFLMAIGTFFSPIRNNRRRQAKMVIELQGGGRVVIADLIDRGWSNFHTNTKLNVLRRSLDVSSDLGFDTNAATRPMAYSWAMTTLRDGEIEICSRYFVEEMRAIQRTDATRQLAAAKGDHDDRFYSLAMAGYSMHSGETEKFIDRLREQREVAVARQEQEVTFETHYRPFANTQGSRLRV